MKKNLVHLLCLCNFSFIDKMCDVQIKLNKVVLTNSIDYLKQSIRNKKENLLKSESVFHDLKTLKIDDKFNMQQYPNILPKIKNCIKQKKLLYIKTNELNLIKEKYGLQNFQLTIFYHFEKVVSKNGQMDISVLRPQSKIHNVLIVGSGKPILVLFNPFQHSFKELSS